MAAERCWHQSLYTAKYNIIHNYFLALVNIPLWQDLFLCRVSRIFKNIFHQNQRQLNNLQFHQHYHQLFSELEDAYLKTIFEHFNFKFIHFPFQVTVVQRKTQKMGERNLLPGRFSNHLYPASCSHHTTPVGTSYHYKETKEKKQN